MRNGDHKLTQEIIYYQNYKQNSPDLSFENIIPTLKLKVTLPALLRIAIASTRASLSSGQSDFTSQAQVNLMHMYKHNIDWQIRLEKTSSLFFLCVKN